MDVDGPPPSRSPGQSRQGPSGKLGASEGAPRGIWPWAGGSSQGPSVRLEDGPCAVQPAKGPSATLAQLLGRPHRPGVAAHCPAAPRRGPWPPRRVRQAGPSLEQEAWGLREAHAECVTGPRLPTPNRAVLVGRSAVDGTGQDAAATLYVDPRPPARPRRRAGAHPASRTQARGQLVYLAESRVSVMRVFTFYFCIVTPYKSNRNSTVLTRSLQLNT